MNATPTSVVRAWPVIAGVVLLPATVLFAQTAATDLVQLARYDTNRNGRLDPAEIAAMPESARPPVVTSGEPGAAGETVMLSPFEVNAEGRGYYAANTMSGTRLNSKVEDLASSITVITKEQMADFAMLDLNDIFLYEAGTEGTGTYTEFSVDRNGSPVDNSLNPNSANRVRGVGPANISFGNFETSGRVPLDPSNIDAVEISRGPNSTVFGLGNAAGTVNLQPASANVSRPRTQASFRFDDWGGRRSSVDFNRVLQPGVLALRGSVVYQHDAFVRQPSGTDTTRLNGMIRYQPFKRTSITASHSYYNIQGRRPNTTMPRDAVTGWKNAGSPTWDPVTISARINGVRVPGTFTSSTLPPYFANSQFRNFSTLFIDPDGTIGFWSPDRTTSSTNPNTGNQNIVLVNSVPDPIRATQPLFASDPSVTSKELYDWTDLNLAAVNRMHESTGTTHLQVEQIFLDTPRHLLALQLAGFQEDSQRRNRNLIGTAGSSGATGFLHVDVNERMIDGSPNPYFLRPFIGLYNVKGLTEQPNHRATYRAQLAYRLDLRREQSRLRWLGMHQFSGYTEYKETRSRTSIYRDMMLPNGTWYPYPTGTAESFTVPNIAINYYRYYVGDNQGQNIDQAPHDFVSGTYPYRWGNGVTGQFTTAQVRLAPDHWYGSTTAYSSRVIKTRGGVVQSHLLGGRLVTTLGLRDDRQYNRGGANPLFNAQPDGTVTLDYDSIQRQDPDWVFNSGKTKTAGAVVKPFPWLHFYGNVSDSFQPAGTAVGLFLNPLPNPTGTGKDWGIALNFLDGKLVARLNRYETTEINTRNGSNRTLAQRVRSLDFYSPAYTNAYALSVLAQSWVTNAAAAQGRTLSPDQINQELVRLTKLDIAYLTRPEDPAEQNDLVAETQNLTARGTEIELNLNPTSFWTAKLNATQMESIDSKLAPGVSQWIAERLPVWESIIDPELGRPWFTERYGGSNSASQYLASNVVSLLNIARANEGKSRPQIRKYRANVSTSYRLAGLMGDHAVLKAVTVGGALRWEDKGAIGYYGVESLPAVITALDPKRPIYDQAHLYADAFVAYRTRLFARKVGATFQLNVRNLQEGGRLQAISAFPDGTPNGYRIIDPRQFIVTATFDL